MPSPEFLFGVAALLCLVGGGAGVTLSVLDFYIAGPRRKG